MNGDHRHPTMVRVEREEGNIGAADPKGEPSGPQERTSRTLRAAVAFVASVSYVWRCGHHPRRVMARLGGKRRPILTSKG